MVKLVFLCRRRADLTHAEYVRYLLDRHVPLALAHHPTMRRYVVNVVEEARRDAPPLDSIGLLWFDTMTDFRERLYGSPDGERLVTEDVARFMGHVSAYATVEHVQRATAGVSPRGMRTPGAKLIACLGRRPGRSRQRFERHWRERHAPLALRHHPTTGYVTSVVSRRLGRSAPPYDGFAELAFRSAADMRERMYLSPAGRVEIEADMARFLGVVHAYDVAEYVQR
jgi:uncharacterized protein (TIGR02118 family)